MGLKNFSGDTGNNDNNNNGSSNPGGGVPSLSGLMQTETIDISDYIIDYNEKFKTAGPTLFRDKVVQQTIAALTGMLKPNPLLIGAAGTGKTKVVEDIAYRLASNDTLIPAGLQGYHIYELPLSNIVAGSSFVGQLEAKVKAIIDYMTDPANKAILFIDEIHQLVGESQTYEKIAQILKPALARGDMKVIGATTLQEANNLIEDPAFNRRFTRVIVDELSQSQTVEILRQMTPKFFQHYNNKVTVSNDILEKTVALADQYRKAGAHRPDNAITLLDRTMADALIRRHVMEEKAKNDPAVLQAIRSNPLIPITEKLLQTTAIRLMTGNNEKTDLDPIELRTKLSVIKGQDSIVDELIYMMRRHDKGLIDTEGNRPLTLLFAGQSGVGKTAVVKIIADVLTGMKPITLNMTEFHSPASINRIIGSPAGYVGSDSHAELPFDCLESNPYQVILLDEFEKSDKSVQRLFMQAFDEGCIKTAKGKEVDFSKAIIIATTNAGHKERKTNLGFVSDDRQPTAQQTAQQLSGWFDTELLNRFTSIITFNEISKEVYTEIIISTYAEQATAYKNRYPRSNLPTAIPDDELQELVDSTYVATFGARPAKKAVMDYIASKVL